MKQVHYVLPMLGTFLLGSFATAQNADDFKFTSTSAQLLNERIDELESRLDLVGTSELSYGNAVQNNGCKSGKCGKGAFKGGGCWCSPCAGVVADAELLLLRMADSDGSVQQDAMATGSRFTLGYTNDVGRSLRVRWFEYANQEEGLGDEFVVESLDLEYAGRFTLGCNWRGELSVGGRWADLFWEEGTDNYEDALGPVVGVNVRSDIFRFLDIYAGARQSYMFGRNREDDSEYQTFAISELAMGLEASREIGTTLAFARVGAEAQYYHSLADDSEDIGLFGMTIAAGVTR